MQKGETFIELKFISLILIECGVDGVAKSIHVSILLLMEETFIKFISLTLIKCGVVKSYVVDTCQHFAPDYTRRKIHVVYTTKPSLVVVR